MFAVKKGAIGVRAIEVRREMYHQWAGCGRGQVAGSVTECILFC